MAGKQTSSLKQGVFASSVDSTGLALAPDSETRWLSARRQTTDKHWHSLSTQIVRELGRRIVAQTYAPGDLLEEEGALAERYQVSRSVIRDAVKILVGKGLLEVRRGIGTRVRDRSSWGLLDDDVLAWHQSAPPSREMLKQLIELRQVIEPSAARWAAERGDEADLLRIQNAVERMEKEKGTVENFVVADASFHSAILRAACNEFPRSM